MTNVARSTPAPESVRTAVAFLYISVAVDVVGAPFDSTLFSPWPFVSKVTSALLNWTLFILVLGFTLFLIFRISQGRNWARVTALVMTGIMLLAAPIDLPRAFEQGAIVAILSLLSSILIVAACVYLLHKESATWFVPRCPECRGKVNREASRCCHCGIQIA